ncbi:MAG: hypothetical protein EA397_01570 [Deltaproteobacteria bacterium]|nr:MAG: hypothetical protein EA397_01570 [Deltaproteobacteria bacterium]
MILALLFGISWALEPLLPPLEESLPRYSTELTFDEGSPPIYHLRYHLRALHTSTIQSSLGELIEEEHRPFNQIAVEVRVGDPDFDNTGFYGWQNGFSMASLPDRATPRSVELAAWRLTDTAFKQAVEQFSRKKAQFKPPEDHPGDYTLTGPVSATALPPPPAQHEPLRELARALSAEFRGLPHLERGQVFVGHEVGRHAVLDTEGTKVIRPMTETTLRAMLQIRLPDGHRLVNDRLWSVLRPEDLPPLEDLKAEVRQMAEELASVADAPVLDQEVIGPVLFTDAAARDLFRYLLLPQLEGTPPDSPFDTYFGEIGEKSDTVRVGRRVLPPGWTVVDDPTSDLTRPGSFTHDYEGTPATRVEAVESGVVRRLLTSRVPRKETDQSTGHARGSFSNRMAGRTSVTTITPPRQRNPRRLHRMALRLAAPYGRDWYLRVDRLVDPAVRDDIFRFNEPALPTPLVLVKVHADGREERVRGAKFTGVERWILRDIIAAGDQSAAPILLGFQPGDAARGATTGLPGWLEAPDVLIGEVEVLPAPPRRRDAPVLSHPHLASDGE